MKLQAQCFCLKIVPFSAAVESHVVSSPAPAIKDNEEAWGFLKNALKEFLPQTVEPERQYELFEEDEGGDGYFFSCSDSESDNHYYVILKYAVF